MELVFITIAAIYVLVAIIFATALRVQDKETRWSTIFLASTAWLYWLLYYIYERIRGRVA